MGLIDSLISVLCTGSIFMAVRNLWRGQWIRGQKLNTILLRTGFPVHMIKLLTRLSSTFNSQDRRLQEKAIFYAEFKAHHQSLLEFTMLKPLWCGMCKCRHIITDNISDVHFFSVS